MFARARGLLVASVLITAGARVAEPAGGPGLPNPRAQIVDLTTVHDAARFSMFTTNVGSLGFDLTTGSAGTFFPIGTQKSPLFAAGLWVGATVAGPARVTVASYSSEWGPGRILGGVAESDAPQLRGYKVFTIHATNPDTSGWRDYTALAGPQGAPVGTRRFADTSTPQAGDSVDAFGPDLPGDVAIWSVFNDASASRHTNHSGQTPPLGLEVAQTVYSTLGGPAIYVRWQIRNRGSNTLDDTYVALWADPDLGGAGDDLIGYDATRNLGYVYNADDADLVYLTTPPALGMQLIEGPLDPQTSTRLPPYAFVKFIGGTDPAGALQSYHLLRGLQLDGSPVIDPITTLPTRFQVTGNALTGTGWIDANPADRQMMLSAGPLRLAPGDSTDVTFAIHMHTGTDHLASIDVLRCKADYVLAEFEQDLPHAAEPACVEILPVDVHLVSTQILDEGVRLVWEGAIAESGPYRIERRRDGSDFVETHAMPADAMGRLVYVDSDVAPGDHLSYRLIDPYTGEPFPNASASIDIPIENPGALQLVPVVAAPPGARVRFYLPATSEVRLELFDVRGGALQSNELGIVDAGTHERSIGVGTGAGPGIYYVRITGAGQTQTTKVLILDS